MADICPDCHGTSGHPRSWLRRHWRKQTDRLGALLAERERLGEVIRENDHLRTEVAVLARLRDETLPALRAEIDRLRAERDQAIADRDRLLGELEWRDINDRETDGGGGPTGESARDAGDSAGSSPAHPHLTPEGSRPTMGDACPDCNGTGECPACDARGWLSPTTASAREETRRG